MLSPFVPRRRASRSISIRRSRSSTTSASALFGQGTVTFKEKLDLVAGARVDYESKDADLKTFYDPAIAPPTVVLDDESFSQRFAAVRGRATASRPSTVPTPRWRAATRPEGSTRRPLPAAKSTAKRRPGTSKAE